LFANEESFFFEDCLYRILQISQHPQNNFEEISKTIHLFFNETGIKSKKETKLMKLYTPSNTQPNQIWTNLAETAKTRELFLSKLGLQNIGNTCYMNSVIQMFLSTCDEIFLKFFKSQKHILECLDEHRDKPGSLSLILIIFEVLFASSNFGGDSEMKEYMNMYLTQQTQDFLEEINKDPEEKELALVQEENELSLAQQMSKKFDRKRNQSLKTRIKMQNKVNPVMLKYFLGSKKDEFSMFNQADAHEAYLSILDLVDMEKSSFSKSLAKNFETKLINEFSCTKCGYKKLKKESSNIISASFENAVKSQESGNYEIMLSGWESVDQLYMAKVHPHVQCLQIKGLGQYVDKMFEKKEEGEEESIQQESTPADDLNGALFIEPKPIFVKKNEVVKKLPNRNMTQVLSYYTSLGGIVFPLYNCLKEYHTNRSGKGFNEYSEKNFGFEYIADKCKKDDLLLVSEFDASSEVFCALNFKALQKYSIGNLTQKVSILCSRLVKFQSVQVPVYLVLKKIYDFTETVLLDSFYTRNKIEPELRIPSFARLFRNYHVKGFVKLMFLNDFEVKDILKQPISKKDQDETLKDEEIPEYFDDLLHFLNQIFSSKTTQIILQSQKEINNSQELIHDIFMKLMKKKNLSNDIEEEEPENPIYSIENAKVILNSEELIENGTLDLSQFFHNFELVFQSNTILDIFTKLRKKERLQGRLINTTSTAQHLTVNECFNGFFSSSILELNCSKCKVGKEFSTQYKVSKGPKFLAIHLKRFMPKIVRGEYVYVKNSEAVLVDQVIEVNEDRYELEGIVNHFGKINSGHYTYDRVVERIQGDQPGKRSLKIIEYNDSKLKIYIYKQQRIISKDAYIVLYKKATS
jgi:ubiquitin C-terminal hydrolase